MPAIKWVKTMRNRFRKAKGPLALAVALACGLGAMAQQALAQGGAKAGDVRVVLKPSQVLRQKGTQEVSTDAEKGMTVFYNDVLQTGMGGRMRARLDDGSILALGSQSKLRVIEHNKQTEQSTFQIEYGKVRAQVVKQMKPGAHFEIKSNTAVAGVLGTDEVVDAFSPIATLIMCLEGRVTVRNVDPSVTGSVILNPGEVTIVQQGTAPGTPRPASASELESALETTGGAAPQAIADIGTGFATIGQDMILSAADSFGGAGAISGYSWQIARSSDNAAVFSQTVTAASLKLDITTWTPGNYKGTLTVTNAANQTGTVNFGFVVLPASVATSSPQEVIQQMKMAYETLQPTEFMKLFDPVKYTGYAALRDSVETLFRAVSQMRVFVRTASGQVFPEQKAAIYQVDFELQLSLKSDPTKIFSVREQATLRMESGSGWLITDVPQGSIGAPSMPGIPGVNDPNNANQSDQNNPIGGDSVRITPQAGDRVRIIAGGTSQAFILQNTSGGSVTISFDLPPGITLSGPGVQGNTVTVAAGQTVNLVFAADASLPEETVAVKTTVTVGDSSSPGPAIPVTVYIPVISFAPAGNTAANPLPVLIGIGGQQATVQVTSTAGVGDTVSLSATGPGGVTANLVPPSVVLAPGGVSSVLALSAAQGGAQPGPASVNVTPTAGGRTLAPTPLFINLINPFTFTRTSPATVEVPTNGTSQVTFNVGFNAPFNQTVTITPNPPTASGISFTPASVQMSSSGTATFTLNAGAATPNPVDFNFTANAGAFTLSQPLTVNVQPPFQYTLTGAAVSVVPGQSGPVSVQVAAGTGVPQPVTLAVVPGSFNAALINVTGGGSVSTFPGSASFNVSVLPNAPPGTTTFLVQGTAAGNVQQAQVTVTIPGDFSFSGPASVSLLQGSSTTVTINHQGLNGFNAPINTTVNSSNPGITVTGGGTLSPGQSLVLNITASPTASGTATITVVGVSGSVTHTFSIAVLVGSFTISSAAAQPVPLFLGGQASIPVTVTAVAGFAGDVTMTATATGGVIVNSVSPASGGVGTRTVSLGTGPATVAGPATVTITAVSGTATQTLQIALQVSAPFTLTTGAATPLPLPIGGTASLPLTVTGATGFAGDVTLTASAASGVTVNTVAPVTGGSGSRSFTLGTTPNAAAGLVTVTVTATSGNFTTTLQIPVQLSTAFTLSTTAANPLPLFMGGTASLPVTVTGQPGFTGDVTLTAVSSSSDVTVNTVAPVTGGNGTRTFTLGTTATALPGQVTVTITGTSGSFVSTLQVPVQVNPPFILSTTVATPFPLLLGGTANLPITITGATGFTGDVTLTASPAAGITATPPAPVTGGSGTGTFALGTTQNAVAGLVDLTITATSGTFSAKLVISVQLTDGFTFTADPAVFFLGNTSPLVVHIQRLPNVQSSVTVQVGTLPAGIIGVSPTSQVAPQGTDILTFQVTAAGDPALSGQNVTIPLTAIITPSATPASAGRLESGISAKNITANATGILLPPFSLATPNGTSLGGIQSGQSTTTTVGITYLGNPPFSGGVRIIVGAASGVTVQANQTQINGSTTITITVTATGTGAFSFPVTAQAGGFSLSATFSGSIVTPVPSSPVLSITKTHTGNFTQGQSGTYTITVSNGANAAATSGLVTVTDTPPSGLFLSSMSGSGWNCPAETNSCSISDPLGPGSSYSPITVSVFVSPTATSPQVNTAGVSGGGSASASASDSTTIIQLADLAITKTHTGNFTQSQTGATYSITVNNVGGTATSGSVAVTDTLPAGLSATGLSGSGWTCVGAASLTCTRSDALAPGAAYPPITATVNVASNAPASVTNSAMVSGGGEQNTANDTVNDPTTIIQVPAVLTITKTHTGNFAQGQTGATYTVTVSNGSTAGATNGTVTVTETVPSGLTLSSMSGSGWTCATNTCTRSDVLSPGLSYSPIFVAVDVSPTATSPQVNTVGVSGGGSAPASATDSTTIVAPGLNITKTHTGNFNLGQSRATYTVTVSNTGAGPTVGTVTVTDTVPSGLTLSSMSGSGWTCTSNTCTRSDVLNGGASYPAITVSVDVSQTATSPQVNTVAVSGGGSPTVSVTDSTTINLPTLSITKTHTGNFTQGQQGASYTVTVSNAAGAGPTSGMVTVTDTVPSGLTLTSMSGSGWTCTSNTCTRSDVLNSGASYSPIGVLVNVSATATTPQVNQVTVSGGGSASVNASDSTTIVSPPDLTVAKTHAGSFTQNQTGATYTITVSNAGGLATSGSVTLTDTLPSGLTATAISGSGWACSTPPTLTCTRGDALAAGASYPAITLTVNVAGNAPASVTNTATVSGGGEINTANDTANDPTTIIVPALTLTVNPASPQQVNANIPVTLQVVVGVPVGFTTPVTVTVPDGNQMQFDPICGAPTGVLSFSYNGTPGAPSPAKALTLNIGPPYSAVSFCMSAGQAGTTVSIGTDSITVTGGSGSAIHQFSIGVPIITVSPATSFNIPQGGTVLANVQVAPPSSSGGFALPMKVYITGPGTTLAGGNPSGSLPAGVASSDCGPATAGKNVSPGGSVLCNITNTATSFSTTPTQLEVFATFSGSAAIVPFQVCLMNSSQSNATCGGTVLPPPPAVFTMVVTPTPIPQQVNGNTPVTVQVQVFPPSGTFTTPITISATDGTQMQFDPICGRPPGFVSYTGSPGVAGTLRFVISPPYPVTSFCMSAGQGGRTPTPGIDSGTVISGTDGTNTVTAPTHTFQIGMPVVSVAPASGSSFNIPLSSTATGNVNVQFASGFAPSGGVTIYLTGVGSTIGPAGPVKAPLPTGISSADCGPSSSGKVLLATGTVTCAITNGTSSGSQSPLTIEAFLLWGPGSALAAGFQICALGPGVTPGCGAGITQPPKLLRLEDPADKNAVTKQFGVARPGTGLPVLTIASTGVQFSPLLPKEGDWVRVRARVENHGGGDARGVTVALVVNRQAVATGEIDVAAGSSAPVEFEWQAAYQPRLSMAVQVDPEEQIEEGANLLRIAAVRNFSVEPAMAAMIRQGRTLLSVTNGECAGFRFSSGAQSFCGGSSDFELNPSITAAGQLAVRIVSLNGGIMDLGPQPITGMIEAPQVGYQSSALLENGHLYAVESNGKYAMMYVGRIQSDIDPRLARVAGGATPTPEAPSDLSGLQADPLGTMLDRSRVSVEVQWSYLENGSRRFQYGFSAPGRSTPGATVYRQPRATTEAPAAE